MEAALRVKWGKLVPGREQKAIDLFMDVSTYFGKKLADSKITFFEPYFVRTSDMDEEQGFMLVRGPAEEIAKIQDEEEYLTYISTAYYVVEHLKVDQLVVGEGVAKQLERSEKVRAALKI